MTILKNRNQSWDIRGRHFILPGTFLLIFLAIAIVLWVTRDNLFYLFNFSYIGLSVAIGLFLTAVLPKKIRHRGRLVTQFLVGSYMVIFLGIIGKENMQIEGFFFYLLMGVFIGATIHYLIAKIGGTFIFGRGWCSRFSLMKINIKREKCVECFACERACPMDIKLLDYMYEGKRILSTECIACSTCIYVCPTDAVEYTFGFDGGFKEYLRTYGEPVATKKNRAASSDFLNTERAALK